MGLTDADKGALELIIEAATVMDDIFHLQVVLVSTLAQIPEFLDACSYHYKLKICQLSKFENKSCIFIISN